MASKKPSGLGRGLGALLGDDVMKTESSGSLSLPISQVETCSSQPRKRFDDESLQELADSISQHGIIQPLTVRKLSSGYYQIIAGERRWRAARLAGLQEVPVIVIEADDRKAAELAMIENLQREDLNPMEEAAGFQSLIESYHMTQEEAAQRVGKSRSAVTNALRLNTFDPRSAAHDAPPKRKAPVRASAPEIPCPTGSCPVQPAPENKTIQTEGTAMKKTIHIEGMMCGHCEATVKKALEALDGVQSAEVSHEKGTAVVSLTHDVADADLKTAVEARDYTVTGIDA